MEVTIWRSAPNRDLPSKIRTFIKPRLARFYEGSYLAQAECAIGRDIVDM